MEVYHQKYPDEAENYLLRNKKGTKKVAHKRKSKNVSDDESEDKEEGSERDSDDDHDEDDDDLIANRIDGLVPEEPKESENFEESNLDDRTPGHLSQPVIVTDLKKKASSSHSQSGRSQRLKRHLPSPLSSQRTKKMHQNSSIPSTYNTPQVRSKCTLVHLIIKC